MAPPRRTKLTHEEREEALKLIADLFEIDTDEDPDPFIDLPMIAKLAGVAEGTPGQWQQRTRLNQIGDVPFPEPDDTRYSDKPQWCAISTVIEEFLLPTDRWPRGVVARPSTRGKRKDSEPVSLAELIGKDPQTAAAVAELRGDDGEKRTPLQWKYRVKKLRAKVSA